MPPPSASSPATFTSPLPARADAVVVGAGIIGMMSAWFLCKAGLKVAVCEKGRVGGEQSSRNWGWVRQQGRDPAELPIMTESIGIWDNLADDIGGDLGFRREGVIYLANSDERMARYEAWLDIAKGHQLDTRILSAPELGALIPGLSGSWNGALYTPSDGRAEPFIAVPAIARAAADAGVTILEDCAVRTVEKTGGRVSGVVTERGALACERVLVAGGVWSSLFLRNAGVDLPQLAVKATVARTEKAPVLFEGGAASSTFAFRRRQDGGYSVAPAQFHEHYVNAESFRYLRRFWPLLRESWRDTKLRFTGNPMATPVRSAWRAADVSPFEHVRVLDPKPDTSVIEQIRREMCAHLPALGDTGIAEAWSGMIDTTPDVVPVIDETASTPGLFVATGFSGHGFGIGPGAGRVIADLMQGNPVGHDLGRFRLSRFTDGSAMDIGPAL